MATEIIVALIGAAGIILNTLVLRRISASEQARTDGQARMEIVLEGLDACLDGLHQKGCNGKVTAAIQRLDEYKNKKSAK